MLNNVTGIGSYKATKYAPYGEWVMGCICAPYGEERYFGLWAAFVQYSVVKMTYNYS